ncbi:MAG: hypothetical protein RL329_2930 [Bacteroidota bacterium]
MERHVSENFQRSEMYFILIINGLSCRIGFGNLQGFRNLRFSTKFVREPILQLDDQSRKVKRLPLEDEYIRIRYGTELRKEAETRYYK